MAGHELIIYTIVVSDHSGIEVTIEGNNTKRKQDVKILGLDDHGYLLGEAKDGAHLSIHPDGNSFDMMRNLILPNK